MASIQGIYIALFGRPADPLGLEYFNGVTGNGADLAAISDLAATAEYQDRFEGMSNVQIINSIYQSLFGRDADLAGLTFFAQALQDGTFNINNIAIAILDGAQGDDLATVNNKIEAANLFTSSLDTGAEVVAYQGDAAAAQGREFLSGITADDATVPDQAEVDAAIAGLGTGGGIVGQTFTLQTTGAGIPADNIVGTANDDTFRAPIAGNLGTEDTIDGGAGNDRLDATLAAATVSPVVRNVENLFLTAAAAGSTYDASASTGVNAVWATNAGLAGPGTLTLTGISKNTVLGIQDTTVAAAVVNLTATFTDVSGTADSATLALESADAGSTASVAGIENLNINVVSGSAVSVVAADLETVVVNGSGNLNLDVDAGALTDLESVDASGLTGGLTFSETVTEDFTINGGSGNDSITLAAGGTEEATITTGAGNDSIIGTANDDTIDAGTGNDVVTGRGGADAITLGAGNDVAIYGAAADSVVGDMDVIADFNAAGDDTIDLSALGATVIRASAAELISIQNSVDGLAPTATVEDALDAAFAGALLTNTLVNFTFQGNTYVGFDGNNNGAYDAGELAIELTGIVSLSGSDFALA